MVSRSPAPAAHPRFVFSCRPRIPSLSLAPVPGATARRLRSDPGRPRPSVSGGSRSSPCRRSAACAGLSGPASLGLARRGRRRDRRHSRRGRCGARGPCARGRRGAPCAGRPGRGGPNDARPTVPEDGQTTRACVIPQGAPREIPCQNQRSWSGIRNFLPCGEPPKSAQSRG